MTTTNSEHSATISSWLTLWWTKKGINLTGQVQKQFQPKSILSAFSIKAQQQNLLSNQLGRNIKINVQTNGKLPAEYWSDKVGFDTRPKET